MKKELQDKLFKEYPRLFQDKDKSMQETCMCWGISCGDGWYDLLDELCHVVEEHYWNQYLNKTKDFTVEFEDLKQNKITNAYPIVSQVKEKFGGLRFYMTFEDEYINGAIRMAESLSYKICENCGQPGKPNNTGWISTLCEKCRNKK